MLQENWKSAKFWVWRQLPI